MNRSCKIALLAILQDDDLLGGSKTGAAARPPTCSVQEWPCGNRRMRLFVPTRLAGGISLNLGESSCKTRCGG